MDFLKNLSIHDKDRKSEDVNEATVPPPPPPSAIEGPRHESLLEKISSTLGGEHNTVQSTPASTTVPSTVPSKHDIPVHEHLVNRISSVLGDGKGETHVVAASSATTVPSVTQNQSFIEKVGGVFSGEHHSSHEPVTVPPSSATIATSAPASEHPHTEGVHKLAHKISGIFDSEEERERKKQEEAAAAAALLAAQEEARRKAEEERERHKYHPHHLLEKLGLKEEAAPPPPPPKEESLLDKIGSSFGHGHDKIQEEPKKPETLEDKIQATLHHAHHGDEVKKPQEKKQFLDKLKVKLGAKEEQEVDEDALDKAIDFVQEHVLHQGSQKDEGFFERLKDDQIAAAIRTQYKHTTGHEFPIRKRDD